MLAKLSEHSEFFVSAEKCRRLAIGCRICGNVHSYEVKLNDYELAIEQSYYKNLFSFLTRFSITYKIYGGSYNA